MKRNFLLLVLLMFVQLLSAQEKIGRRLHEGYDRVFLNHQIDSIVRTSRDDKIPVIGIGTMTCDDHCTIETVYVNAIRAAGASPILIPISDDVAVLQRALAQIDGLLIPGGQDVHPFFYGEQPQPSLGGILLERDYFELILIRLARQMEIPIMGCCRGMQMVNVALGGTLCQDIPSAEYLPRIQHGQWSSASTPHHLVKIEKGSRLYSILGSEAQVNSFHHQCVKDVAEGLRITAYAPDGVPEAIEGDGILCVQFHPESMIEKHPEMLEIYKDFVKSAAERSMKKSK